MQILQGNFLISTTVSGEDMFERSVVLIAEQNDSGYIGFIINKSFPRRLNELQEFIHNKPLRMFSGGPVDTDHIFFIHKRSDIIEGGTQIMENIFLGGDFGQAIDYLNDGLLSENDLKIFVGYCGWDATQLKEEIEAGWWLKYDYLQYPDNIFSAGNTLWSNLYNQKI